MKASQITSSRYQALNDYIEQWECVSRLYKKDLRILYRIYGCILGSHLKIQASDFVFLLKEGLLKLKSGITQKEINLIENYPTLFDAEDPAFKHLVLELLVLDASKVETYFASGLKVFAFSKIPAGVSLFRGTILRFLEIHLELMDFDPKLVSDSTHRDLLMLTEILSIADILKAIKTTINSCHSLFQEEKHMPLHKRTMILNHRLSSIYANFKKGDFILFKRIHPKILQEKYGLDIDYELQMEEFWLVALQNTPEELAKRIASLVIEKY